ncbi:hypothetical protein [Sphingomonas sp. IW22]|uniref:hypothetical protein n=1 Tax=Sphingomonas sp. IW22 TaxID=3242489 RepID=UPI003521F2AC
MSATLSNFGLGRREADLETEMGASANHVPPALLHPRLAQIYRGKSRACSNAFEAEGVRSEAQKIIRNLIDVVIMPPGSVLHAGGKRLGDDAGVGVKKAQKNRREGPEAV